MSIDRERPCTSHRVQDMKVSTHQEVESGQLHRSIGRIRVAGHWRGAVLPVTESDRLTLVRALIVEAESYDADAIVALEFDVESVRSAEIDLPLRRVTATCLAVRYAQAA